MNTGDRFCCNNIYSAKKTRSTITFTRCRY